ncbi:unnamed protein product [Prunus brigantina]
MSYTEQPLLKSFELSEFREPSVPVWILLVLVEAQMARKDHCLEIRNFLVFDYDGDSKFDVTIYEPTGCEKDVEAAKRRNGNPVSSVKDEIVDIETENYNKEIFTLMFQLQTIPKERAIAEGLVRKKTVKLQDPAGRSWIVKHIVYHLRLSRTSTEDEFANVLLEAQVGKDHHLEVGNFLVFRYDGESKFKVTIYDRSACEKDVEIAERGIRSSVSIESRGNQVRVKEEIIDLETENYNEDCENKTSIANRRNRNAMSGKKPTTDYVEETSSECISFKSDNRCFMETMKRALPILLHYKKKYQLCSKLQMIPKKLAIAEGLKSARNVTLRDPNGRLWLLLNL